MQDEKIDKIQYIFEIQASDPLKSIINHPYLMHEMRLEESSHIFKRVEAVWSKLFAILPLLFQCVVYVNTLQLSNFSDFFQQKKIRKILSGTLNQSVKQFESRSGLTFCRC